FATLGGRPMLEWSLDALRAAGIEEIVVALPAGEDAPEGTVGVRGGETRTQSVAAALTASRGDPVVVHDAARPLVTAETIRVALDGLEGHEAVVVATPVTDTIKEVAQGTVVRTVPREGLWAAQTPQVLRRAALERGLAAATGSETDDVALVEAEGRVRVIEGPPENFKVTTPADLAAAEALLRCRRRLDVVRGIIEAVNAGRMEEPFAHYHDDVLWDLSAMGHVLDLTIVVHRGHDGVRRYWRDWLSAWETVRFEVDELFAIGDSVVQYQRLLVRGRRSGVELEIPDYAQVWTFRGEKIAEMRLFADRAEAVRFARESPC
ncbi:MAG TPA: 2-C-methyl-D-erythritol 4-phosphate cytidylyltransferase, partial [Solirubrobacteraceae bacterium]|nr:2-C-methyl-D-erythritol 4-phosphate cytidylyltransferase [Solirubrobacteraceae bacterium]